MSKVLFTVAFYHDGPSRKPHFIISTNNLYGVQVKGADFQGVKLGNPNLNGGFRNRFEYSVSGGKSVTRLSLVMNTSVVLPHMTWATKHPVGPPTGSGKRGPRGELTRLRPGEEKGGSSGGRSNGRSHHRIESRKEIGSEGSGGGSNRRPRRRVEDRWDRRGRRPSRHDIDDGWVDADDGYDVGGD